MNERTDAELVALARAGDKDAFGQLVGRYQSMARRVAVGMVANEDMARQLVQEAILQAYLSLAHLRDDGRFKSWLYGIVLNVCRSYFRDQKAVFFSWDAMVGGLRFEAIHFSGACPDPQSVMEEQELHRKVLAAVEALSAKNRAATLLFYYDQLSLREIAAILGISVTAVKGRLHRSRQQLREWLLPVYSEMILEEPRRKTMTTEALYQEVTVDAIHQKQETTDAYIVVLLDAEGRRVLPIWIGRPELEAMALHLLERPAVRPLTYNFIANLLEAVGTRLEKVCVEALQEGIFYATAYLDDGDAVHQVDARPSDAINLALCTGSPIYVAKEILEQVGIDVPENVWERQQLGRGVEDMAQEWDRGRQEWERKREEAKSRPRPTEQEAEQKREKGRQELLDLVFGAEA